MGYAACGSEVRVEAFVEARLALTVSTNDPNCRQSFPGLTCTYVNASATAPIQLSLRVESPSYYANIITVVFTATCPKPGTTVSGSIPLQNANGAALQPNSVVLSASSDGATSSSATATTASPADLGSRTTSDPSLLLAPGTNVLGTMVPANAARVQPQVLGIFSFAGAQASCLEPLFGTWIMYAILTVAFLVVRLTMAHRAKGEIPNTHHKISQWRSLLIHHPYVGLFVPCHAQCVFIHVVNPFCHVLAIIMSAALLIRLFASQNDETMASLWIFGVLAVVFAQPWKPLLHYYYSEWRYDEKQLQADIEDMRRTIGSKKGAPLLTSLKNATIDSGTFDLANIQMVEEEEGSQGADSLEDIPSKPCRTISTLDLSNVKLEEEGTLFTVTSPADEEADDLPPIQATVLTNLLVTYGHIANAVFAVLVTVVTYSMVAAFGKEMRCDRFVGVLWRALLLDVFGMQSLAVVLTWMYRWMTATGTEPLPDATDEEKPPHGEALWSELHPFHGDKRTVY